EAATFFTFGIEGETYSIEDGKVKYDMPQTKEDIEEEGWRTGAVWQVRDVTYNAQLLELGGQDGLDTMEAFEEVLSKEGLEGIGFYPQLESSAKFPDLGFPGGDVGP